MFPKRRHARRDPNEARSAAEKYFAPIFWPFDWITASALNNPEIFSIVTVNVWLTKSHASFTATWCVGAPWPFMTKIHLKRFCAICPPMSAISDLRVDRRSP